MTKDNRRAASPVQAGIDPLVAEIEAQITCAESIGQDGMANELRKIAAGYRSQAERIAALEKERDTMRAKAISNARERNAAESLLAEAREALEQISAGPMFAVTDVKRWAEWAAEFARATLSRLKPGEKGGGE